MAKLKIRLLAALLLASLALTGCTGHAQAPSDETVIVLPEPQNTDIAPFYGESSTGSPHEVTLYYVSENRYALSGVTSTIFT